MVVMSSRPLPCMCQWRKNWRTAEETQDGTCNPLRLCEREFYVFHENV